MWFACFSECFPSITSLCSSLKTGRVTPTFTGVSGTMTCPRSHDSFLAARFLTFKPRAFPLPRAFGHTCFLLLSVVVRLVSRHLYSFPYCWMGTVMATSAAAEGPQTFGASSCRRDEETTTTQDDSAEKGGRQN